MSEQMLNPSLPWWKVPTVWLALGGPAVVVVASLATLAIALRWGDEPLAEARVPRPETMTPATQARNHAAAPRR